MDRLSRKTISDAFYQHEIEAELRDRRLAWSFHGNEEESLKSVLFKLNELRSSEIYPHSEEDCLVSCALKGIFSLLILNHYLKFYIHPDTFPVTPKTGWQEITILFWIKCLLLYQILSRSIYLLNVPYLSDELHCFEILFIEAKKV